MGDLGPAGLPGLEVSLLPGRIRTIQLILELTFL